MNDRSFMRPLIAVGCMAAFLLSGCSTTDVPAATEPLPTEAPYTVENIGGIDCYSVDGRVYAAELGAPVLDKDAVIELFRANDYDAAAEKISNIGDAFSYLKLKPKRIGGPKDACSFVADLISADYDSLGFIEFDYTDDRNIGDSYCILYVEQSGTYYAVDVYARGSDWITNPENDCFSNADIDVLVEKLTEAFPFPGTVNSVGVSADIDKHHGAKVFSYIGTTFPEGLGQPVLSDEEIDALIAEQDYAKTAETITTLADAVNYYRRAGFTFNDDTYTKRVGDFIYYPSAWQVLKDNKGQCKTMSNLNAYLLQGDYDEVGHVAVRSPGDGHAMTYILEDGMYYLVNSVDYTFDRSLGWLDSYPTVLGCAADFQDIADSLVNNMSLGDKEFVNMVHLVNSTGDLPVGMRGNKPLYPDGCDVIVYYGGDITYAEASLDWQSQTRIDY
ncbi:MAG: hypothetical protein IJ364_04580 [Oscillospiraceae bacterium]|nr:hypothetical protein [Oscillospiraceae bacterium]